MNLLTRIFQRNQDPGLLGLWRQVTPEVSEPVMAKFSSGGQLEYHITERSRVGIMKLTYRIEGSDIISNQPSAPREERTAFALVGPDVLVLTHGGEETRFTRVVLREYDIVRIARLLKTDRFYNGTDGAMRSPAVGDVATICHDNDPFDPNSAVVVEMGDQDGNTIWLADFAREELELVKRP